MKNPVWILAMTLVVIAVGLSVAVPRIAARQGGDFLCYTDSGFGERVGLGGEYRLDLQCQPALAETIEIEPDAEITITVDLTSYYAKTGAYEAEFDIHIAMKRANIELRERGARSGVSMTDGQASLQDVSVTTNQDTFTFTITNNGFRSAIFDVTVRPVR